MKVVHTVGTLLEQHGGPSRSVCALASAVAARGIDAVIITRRGPAAQPHTLPSHGGVAVRFLGPVRALRPARAITEAMQATSAPVLHDHGLWLPINHASAQVSRANGVPRVVSPRGMLAAWALEYRPIRKQLAWRAYQRQDLLSATVVHATSDQEAEEVRRAGFRGPIAVVPNGVETAPSRPRPADRPVRRALFLSRIHPKKGLLNLVAAWAEVAPAGWELAIVGPDADGHADEVRRAVDRLRAPAVTIAGAAPEAAKWDWYASADLFVLPTFNENFGIVVAEALAAGVPVITTTGSPWEELRTTGSGWWIEPTTPALAAALREACALPRAVLGEMGARGRALVERRYAWARMAADMDPVYRWLAGAGPRPPIISFE